MDINDIISSNDIKQLGTIEELIKIINSFMQPFVLNVQTYEELYDAINFIKKNIKLSDEIFCSKEKEYLFYLTVLDGEQRNKLLGITDIHYEDKDKAKRWYKKIVNYVHPDKNKDNNAEEAFIILKKIFNQLTDEDYDE
jgi:hypothetical protein